MSSINRKCMTIASYNQYCQSLEYSTWRAVDEKDEEIMIFEDQRFEGLNQEL